MSKSTRGEGFDAKYIRRGDDECWIWQRGKNSHGYGYFHVRGVGAVPAHRYAFERAYGTIPKGMLIDHRCRVRACVNPAHLQLATQKTNGENLRLSSVNTSGVRGVSWHKLNNAWAVTAKHNRRRYWGGYYRDLEEAKAAAVALRNRLHTNNLADREAV